MKVIEINTFQEYINFINDNMLKDLDIEEYDKSLS